MSFSFGGSNTADTGGAGGGSSGSILSDINIVKPIDSGTVKIFEYLAEGKHLPKAEINFVKTVNGAEVWYMRIELADCVITKVNYGFAQEGVSIAWRRLTMRYRQVHADGSTGGEVVFGWDRTTNTQF